MHKFYLLVLFTAFTFFAQAQQIKGTDSSLISGALPAKVLRFYPNPATSIINFEFLKPLQRNYILQVYNFVGKKVFESNTVSQRTAISLTEFFRGVYIFQLRDKSGRIIESGKFQVSK